MRPEGNTNSDLTPYEAEAEWPRHFRTGNVWAFVR